MRRDWRAILATATAITISLGAMEAGRPDRVAALTTVTLERTPDAGIQPQVAVDAAGTVHLVFFKGEAAHGDLFYVHRNDGDAWSAPLRVNSQPGSALATGSVRGGHLAVGRNGRIHVAWFGSSIAAPRQPGGKTPMLYSRLNESGTRFEPQRNVVQLGTDLDGGAVAADAAGHVFVTWHGLQPGATDEAHRAVWMARSNDDGVTFARAVPISPSSTGACGCCGTAALVDRQGALDVLYRSAVEMVHRDAFLLHVPSGGAAVESRKLEEWNVGGCPMSTFSLAETPAGVLAAWETDGHLGWTRLAADKRPASSIVAVTSAQKNLKHPAIAGNARGETLVAWTEGTAWNKGGALGWQRYDRADRPTGDRGHAAGVPTWGLAAVAPRPDGGFLILY